MPLCHRRQNFRRLTELFLQQLKTTTGCLLQYLGVTLAVIKRQLATKKKAQILSLAGRLALSVLLVTASYLALSLNFSADADTRLCAPPKGRALFDSPSGRMRYDNSPFGATAWASVDDCLL